MRVFVGAALCRELGEQSLEAPSSFPRQLGTLTFWRPCSLTFKAREMGATRSLEGEGAPGWELGGQGPVGGLARTPCFR